MTGVLSSRYEKLVCASLKITSNRMIQLKNSDSSLCSMRRIFWCLQYQRTNHVMLCIYIGLYKKKRFRDYKPYDLTVTPFAWFADHPIRMISLFTRCWPTRFWRIGRSSKGCGLALLTIVIYEWRLHWGGWVEQCNGGSAGGTKYSWGPRFKL
jgi:hypothetical protein